MRLLVTLALVLAIVGCGKKAKKHTNDGTLKFSIEIPEDVKPQPEKSDGVWRSVTMTSMGKAYMDILVNWRPGASFDDTLAVYNQFAQERGSVAVYKKEDLPEGKGFYIHFQHGAVERADTVMKCGGEAIQCLGTIGDDVKGDAKEHMLRACKSITCP